MTQKATVRTRTPWQVTKSVWYAMFMREALARTTGDRFAAFWMIAEPVAFVLLFIAVREFLGRMKFIAGADFVPWLIVGLMTFFLFREGMMRSLGAINANKALFTYRQVKPVDTVFVRCAVEFTLRTFVFIILLCGAGLFGFSVFPYEALDVIFIWLSVWLLGIGVGLVLSVGATLIPEVERIVKMTSFPLMLMSGVMFPVNFLSHDVQEIILYNPVIHGVESIRLAFFEGYFTLGGIDLLYMYYWSLSSIALGLALHVKFAMKLKAQ
tara:strand:+ start:1184 stop:1987 length:804 start_codon:yes stop_codon:yes gene_type:complete